MWECWGCEDWGWRGDGEVTEQLCECVGCGSVLEGERTLGGGEWMGE